MIASTPPASTWLATATRPAVVRRALGTAVVVGAALIAINHGDAVVAGAVDGARALKMALTVLVPYCVSTASSVGAIMERSGASQSDTTRPGARTGLEKKGATR
jgi:adenine deaminase